MNEQLRRRRSDIEPERCPMTPDQVDILLANQQRLMEEIAVLKESVDNVTSCVDSITKYVGEIKKYLFAGRIVAATIVCIGLTLDWTRDHIGVLKAWINK